MCLVARLFVAALSAVLGGDSSETHTIDVRLRVPALNRSVRGPSEAHTSDVRLSPEINRYRYHLNYHRYIFFIYIFGLYILFIFIFGKFRQYTQ